MSRHLALGIGALVVSREPAVVSTVLGSCVSVCLYAPRARLGGVIHYALPDPSVAPTTERSPLHFGTTAIRLLAVEVLSLAHASPGELQAKIVGGAAVVSQLVSGQDIGAQNLSVARRTLADLGIPVVGESAGGRVGFKLYFYTDSGRLRVARLHSAAA